MTIRSQALSWLATRRPGPRGHVVTSKWYTPDESWTKENAWWVQIPSAAIRSEKTIEILCEAAPGSARFRHL
ncbi:hypothetical protein J421_5317 (plasmid) [Gemmatirosa kalamazoonensis]|uniref:Uncharacterized protein n=1 Tax=Gemmatirosa kalamazoonensis TaxID=861299 RepID=W0RQW1_9BACT|nr:hypothetical protein J421_5317 [Gemmatirosa kalamazoonensis]